MAMPKRYYLDLGVGYGQDHDASIFKCDLRSKAEVEAYFGAAVTIQGTEGVDYEFDADKGFRALQDGGAIEIDIGSFLSADEKAHFPQLGWTFDFQLWRDEWIEPEPPVSPAYINPISDMDGSAAGALANTYLLTFWENNTYPIGWARLKDDTTTVNGKGRNRLEFAASPNPANPAACARPISRYNMPEYISCRMTSIQGCGAAWIENYPAVAPHGGTSTGLPGERLTWRNNANQDIREQTTGDLRMFIGAYYTLGGTCTRWVRNIRMFKTANTPAFHPWLARVVSFGDSYSAGTFGPVGTADPDKQTLGSDGAPGSYNTSVDTYFGHVHPILAFYKRMADSGFHIGGMYGAGQGGHWFSDYTNGTTKTSSLYNLGYTDTLLERYMPTMVFTNGIYNDTARVRDGDITVAALKSQLLTNYLKPAMDNGCELWGIAIPGYSKDVIDNNWTDTWGTVADMLLSLPAAFDAAYPEHTGKVKVKDLRTVTGNGSLDNRNWRSYWESGEVTHPSKYGQVLFADACADMAIERILSP